MSSYTEFAITSINDLIDNYAVNKDSIDYDDLSVPVVCKCPYCVNEKHNEPSMKPTLYVYRNSLSFWCFRCHTYGIDSSLKLDSKEYRIKSLERSLKSLMTPKLINSFYPISIDHLPRINSFEYLNYFIQKRSSKYIPHLDQWNFREITFMNRKGFLIPFYYNNLLVSYQIRYIDDIKTMKYYTNEGTKLPYFVNGYNKSKDYSTITLVEGVFDALAGSLFNLPNPIAVLGSSIPKHIYEFITLVLKPTKIIYAFDDMKINNKIKSQFDLYIHDSYYIDTNSEDLDEYLRLGKVPKVVKYEDEDHSLIDGLLAKFLNQGSINGC